MSAPPRGWMALRARNPPLSVSVLLGDGAWRVSGGYGGWETVQRPRRVSLTEWQGRDPIRLTGPVMIDAFRAGAGLAVERACAVLERMAGLGYGQPPTLTVQSWGVVPHDAIRHPSARWVVDELSWDDGALVDGLGNRVRAPATLTLLQHVADERLATVAHEQREAKAKRKCHSPHVRRVTVHRHDTLQAIARRYLGSPDCWRAIAQLNGIRDPRRLKSGRVLKLP